MGTVVLQFNQIFTLWNQPKLSLYPLASLLMLALTERTPPIITLWSNSNVETPHFTLGDFQVHFQCIINYEVPVLSRWNFRHASIISVPMKTGIIILMFTMEAASSLLFLKEIVMGQQRMPAPPRFNLIFHKIQLSDCTREVGRPSKFGKLKSTTDQQQQPLFHQRALQLNPHPSLRLSRHQNLPVNLHHWHQRPVFQLNHRPSRHREILQNHRPSRHQDRHLNLPVDLLHRHPPQNHSCWRSMAFMDLLMMRLVMLPRLKNEWL